LTSFDRVYVDRGRFQLSQTYIVTLTMKLSGVNTRWSPVEYQVKPAMMGADIMGFW
jgi:hypothetical protein